MTIRPLNIDPTHCFIANKWVPALSGQTLALKNPSDGTTLCDIARGNAADIDRAVAAADAALNGAWGELAAFERGRILHRIGELVLENIDELTTLESMDVGKPVKQARADVVALARYMEFYAGAVDKIHGATIPFLGAIPSIPCANLTGLRAISSRGITRCRSSDALLVPPLPWATPPF